MKGQGQEGYATVMAFTFILSWCVFNFVRLHFEFIQREIKEHVDIFYT